MSALRVGTTATYPPLAGKWSVWSKASEAPGAYFVIPADAEAQALGVKYAVIRVTQKATELRPEIRLIRTDPHKPELFETN